MKLADRVRLLRKRRGWSQKELGERAGLSNGYVSMLERAGELDGAVIDDPKVSTVEALAEALGAAPEWLAFGAGPRPDMSPAHVLERRAARARREAAREPR